MRQQDVNWFRPLWLRIVVTVAVGIWCAVEWFVWQDSLWAMIVTAALAYCVWQFFISFPKGTDGKPEA